MGEFHETWAAYTALEGVKAFLSALFLLHDRRCCLWSTIGGSALVSNKQQTGLFSSDLIQVGPVKVCTDDLGTTCHELAALRRQMFSTIFGTRITILDAKQQKCTQRGYDQIAASLPAKHTAQSSSGSCDDGTYAVKSHIAAVAGWMQLQTVSVALVVENPEFNRRQLQLYADSSDTVIVLVLVIVAVIRRMYTCTSFW